MTRTRLTARKAGTHFERLIADHLAATIDDRIDRRVKTGNTDKGDIAGVRIPAGRIVIECKNTTKMALATWVIEAATERDNDGALLGIVIAKRHGHAAPGRQWVHMTVDDLIALITGTRPPS